MRDFKAARRPDGSSRGLRVRVRLLQVVYTLLLAVVLGRAIKLQVYDQEKLHGLAKDQYLRQMEIPARRGDIFDRRGVPLAQSVEVDSLWIDPSLIENPQRAVADLSRVLRVDSKELGARLAKGKRFAWVKRQATPEEVRAAKALNLPGLGVAKEPRRFYPQRELAAQVLGVVGTDGHGLEGLERAFEDELSGKASQLVGYRDAKGRKLLLEGSVDTRSREGAQVTLTIDRHVQFVAERALAKAVEDAKAVAGMALVGDPRTGEILALANYPKFNPNLPKGASAEVLRNRAALDLFEPGSTLKPFVVAAALEKKTLRTNEAFYCEKGAWKVGRNRIHDTHSYEWLDAGRILQVSSNIGIAKIGQNLGRERLVQAYSDFGFGQRTDLALPGEGKGSIPYPKADIALATQSFGQGLSVTAVQLLAAYGALANGGVLMKPYLVQKVVDPDGVVLLEHQPTPIRQVVSKKVAQTVLTMLESVVQKEGTAPLARMDEYTVAGKTGTAQKVDPVARGYSDKRIASFSGVVPSENPRAVILVIVDEPKTDVYGGLVAAPAFKEIAAATLPYLGVSPGDGRRLAAAGPELASKGRNTGGKSVADKKKPLDKAVTLQPASTVTEWVEGGDVEVPDLSGRPMREAITRLLSAALQPQVTGTGLVVSQNPPPGVLVIKGTPVVLELARQ